MPDATDMLKTSVRSFLALPTHMHKNLDQMGVKGDRYVFNISGYKQDFLLIN